MNRGSPEHDADLKRRQ